MSHFKAFPLRWYGVVCFYRAPWDRKTTIATHNQQRLHCDISARQRKSYGVVGDFTALLYMEAVRRHHACALIQNAERRCLFCACLKCALTVVIEKTVDDGERRTDTDNRDGTESLRGGLIILVSSVYRYTKEVHFNIYRLLIKCIHKQKCI